MVAHQMPVGKPAGTPLPRRTAAKYLAGSLFTLLLTGVGTARANVFPRGVSHAFGETLVPGTPGRIVTLGWSGEDALIALGKTPVGMPKYPLFESGMFPWVEGLLGTNKPVLLNSGIDYEEIASLRPDLIFCIYSGIDAVAYRRLSTIAPTIAYRSGPWQADWKEQTQIIGESLGLANEARGLISQTLATLSKIGCSHPVLKGKTFTFGTFVPGAAGVVVYLPNDHRVAALMSLGMKPAAGIKALHRDNPESSSVTVNLEQIDRIDADVLVMWYGTGASKQAAEAQPLLALLPAVQRGSYVALADPVSVWATSALSVLSIPYGFPRFVPRLADAARKAEQNQ
ncbi:putative siderophore-binding lipoprotein YfiY precursor [compost metagenome]